MIDNKALVQKAKHSESEQREERRVESVVHGMIAGATGQFGAWGASILFHLIWNVDQLYPYIPFKSTLDDANYYTFAMDELWDLLAELVYPENDNDAMFPRYFKEAENLSEKFIQCKIYSDYDSYLPKLVLLLIKMEYKLKHDKGKAPADDEIDNEEGILIVDDEDFEAFNYIKFLATQESRVENVGRFLCEYMRLLTKTRHKDYKGARSSALKIIKMEEIFGKHKVLDFFLCKILASCCEKLELHLEAGYCYLRAKEVLQNSISEEKIQKISDRLNNCAKNAIEKFTNCDKDVIEKFPNCDKDVIGEFSYAAVVYGADGIREDAFLYIVGSDNWLNESRRARQPLLNKLYGLMQDCKKSAEVLKELSIRDPNLSNNNNKIDMKVVQSVLKKIDSELKETLEGLLLISSGSTVKLSTSKSERWRENLNCAKRRHYALQSLSKKASFGWFLGSVGSFFLLESLPASLCSYLHYENAQHPRVLFYFLGAIGSWFSTYTVQNDYDYPVNERRFIVAISIGSGLIADLISDYTQGYLADHCHRSWYTGNARTRAVVEDSIIILANSAIPIFVTNKVAQVMGEQEINKAIAPVVPS